MKLNYKIKLKCINCNYDDTFDKKNLKHKKTKLSWTCSYIKSFFICKNCGYEIYWKNPEEIED